ncbi:hypothetical protein ACHQM5_018514 [Ranunculus cassubicifolius]
MSSSPSKPHTPKYPLKPRFKEPATKGFIYGVLTGSILHFSKSLYNPSPSSSTVGSRSRINGAFLAVTKNAPRVGCTFATGFILYDVARCEFANYTRNDGILTTYTAIGVAAGIVNVRKGYWVAVRWAVSVPIVVLLYKLGKIAAKADEGNVRGIEGVRSMSRDGNAGRSDITRK